MRTLSLVIPALLVLTATARPQDLFDVPLRINMGGPETVDSFGRTWLGDAGGDPQNIRPNDLGGVNESVNWSTVAPDSLAALGFDPTHPGDVAIFSTIRWDWADDGFIGYRDDDVDFRLEIPLPDADYILNLYFNEGCCPQRHFKIEVQGEIVDDDVSYLDYDKVSPGLGRVGVLSFPVSVRDRALRIGLLPCRECPCPECSDTIVMDNNAIIDALEVISDEGCDHRGLDFACSFDAASGSVTGTWKELSSAETYQVLREGDVIGEYLAGTTSFEDPSPRVGGAGVIYDIVALDGGVPISSCRCYLKAFVCPSDLICTVLPGEQGSQVVALSWTPGSGILEQQVKRNGTLVATLPADASSYDDTPDTHFVEYELVVSDPAEICASTCRAVVETAPFSIPLRINMGGRETVDSKGRTWLGDGPSAGDPLAIRDDDRSGTNCNENWSTAAMDPASFLDLGFDPTHPGDAYIFNTIRWDVGDDGVAGDPLDNIDFRLSIPVPNGQYLLNLYFNEGCCTFRHFKIELQGEMKDEDVSYLDYLAVNPGLGKLGRISYQDVPVADGSIFLGLLPCPECPGATDLNAIIDAIEVLPAGCADPEFRQCPRNFTCQVTPGGSASLSWEAPLCMDVTGYEVYRDGTLIQALESAATSLSDQMPSRVAMYRLKVLTGAGVDPCDDWTCQVFAEDLDFPIPLRINMGGHTAVDSRGRTWWGDGPGAGDPLGIRVDDAGGTNGSENWCLLGAMTQTDALQSFGLDPEDPNDASIFGTIRWDVGDDGIIGDRTDDIEWRMEIPVPSGSYRVGFYFLECGWPQRHFQLWIEDSLAAEDINYLLYDPQDTSMGRTGRIVFDADVADGFLSLGLLPCLECPCPECIGTITMDSDAILSALEVLPENAAFATCPRSLMAVLEDDGKVTGTWTPGDGVTASGYDLYRNGEKIASLPGTATSFVDEPEACTRAMVYELAPLSEDPNFLCPGERMASTVIDPSCPFEPPVRINMGGFEVVDSLGNRWLGDGPGSGDPLEIRPDDTGGDQYGENFSTGVFQPDSLAVLGWDPKDPIDAYIFNTIRYDLGNTGAPFVLEIPLPAGEYQVDLYFNEGCCLTRHAKVLMQGEIVDPDVFQTVLGRVNRRVYDNIQTPEGVLTITLLNCPECAATIDPNPLLDALEIFYTGSVPPAAPTNLQATPGDARVDLTWDAVAGVAGYNLYRTDTAGGDLAKVNPTLLTAMSYADTKVVNGTLYYYHVRSVSADGLESGNSLVATALPKGTAGTPFKRGDADGSGKLDLTDAIATLQFLYMGYAAPECKDAADTDDSGKLDLTDAIASLQFQFMGGTPPAAPGPTACGPDPTTGDEYTECIYTKC
jgi:hypothetical protein